MVELAYARRLRPDGYPSDIFRHTTEDDFVDQYAFGRFFRVQDLPSNGSWLRGAWIQDQVDRGLMYQLHGDTTKSWLPVMGGNRLPCLRGARVSVYMPEEAVEIVAAGDVEQALREAGPWAVNSLSELEQARPWYVHQSGRLSMEESWPTLTEPVSGWYAEIADAASRRFRARMPIVAFASRRVDFAVEPDSPPWQMLLAEAAKQSVADVEERRARQALEELEDKKRRTRKLVDRLRELSGRPSPELTPDEYREKMRLKRAVGGLL